MNFAEKSKEEKQKIILGVMVIAVVFFGVNNVVIAPNEKAIERAEKVIDELQRQVSSARRDVKFDVNTRRKIIEEVETIDSVLAKMPEGRLRVNVSKAYATDLANKVGVELISTLERSNRFSPLSRDANYFDTKIRDNTTVWVPFSLAVTCNGTFDQILRYMRELQDNNPYVSIGYVNIGINEDTPPEIQQATIILEWPNPRVDNLGRYLENMKNSAKAAPKVTL